MNLRKRFVVFSIIWGIVLVVISTSVSISNFKDKNIQLIKQNIITSARDQSENLEHFFKHNISELKITSSIPVVKDLLIASNNNLSIENNRRDRNILNEILVMRESEHNYIYDTLLVNKDETIIASSNSNHINEKIILKDDELYRLKINEAVITDIIEKEDFNRGIKSTIIANPIFINNEYQGALINVINMDFFKNSIEDIKFFKTGKVMIMDEHGTIAASNSMDIQGSIHEINSTNNLYDKWKAIDFISNPDGIIEYEIAGIEKIGYYSKINDTGWIVLSGVEWAEFTTPINESIKNIVIIIIILLVIIMASYGFIINHVSKPIYDFIEVLRKIKRGDTNHRFIYNKPNEFGEIALVFNDLMDSIENKNRDIEEKNRDLKALTSNIPGGVHRNKIENGNYILNFLSEGCLNVLGYTKDELDDLYGKDVFEFVYERDREKTKKEIIQQIRKYNKYTVEYRIRRKDGSIIWLLDNGNIVNDRNGNTFSYSVVINITESKNAQEKLRLSEERYRIIMSQTEDVIFEWNVKEDTVYFSENWATKFNHDVNIMEVSKKIHDSAGIFKDDFGELGNMLNKIIMGEKYKETEIRIKDKYDRFIWCKIRATAMFDADGNIFKVMGVIVDIHKEKIEAQDLLYKAERDSLTKLYNKGTAENMIRKYMEEEIESSNRGALFVIDVDNFKAINDNLGHLFGDNVLSEIGKMLSDIFNEDSIVGRIGGDEFIVFLKNVNSEEFIYKKAEELVKGFRRNFIHHTLNYKVSGSIGIAKYPKHGTNYEELFANADKAVYLAKNKGKDNYCVFKDI